MISLIFDWSILSHALKSCLFFWLESMEFVCFVRQRCNLITVIYVTFVLYNYVFMFMYITMTRPRFFVVVCTLLLELPRCDVFSFFHALFCNVFIFFAVITSDYLSSDVKRSKDASKWMSFGILIMFCVQNVCHRESFFSVAHAGHVNPNPCRLAECTSWPELGHGVRLHSWNEV